MALLAKKQQQKKQQQCFADKEKQWPK